MAPPQVVAAVRGEQLARRAEEDAARRARQGGRVRGGVVAEESSSESSKNAENLLEKYCPVVEEIHGFAASKTGHCYQSLLAMYGRSSKPRDFYTLLEFVRTKHEIESSCAAHPHISTCSSNLYKFDADRKNALVYSSQRMNSAITNYFRVSGRERKEMVRVSNLSI